MVPVLAYAAPQTWCPLELAEAPFKPNNQNDFKQQLYYKLAFNLASPFLITVLISI